MNMGHSLLLRFFALAAVAAGLLWNAHEVCANPSGEQVVAGSAQFTRDGNTLTIQQGSQRAIINWQDFSIGTGQLTKFLQPGSNAAALNRVISGNPSQILGTLEANGQVILVNPNGIVVGAGASINAGSFIASTLDVANDQFMAGGELRFLGDSTAGISNAGTIQTQGDLMLVSRQIENSGTLRSAAGVVGLGAGEEVLIRPVGDERLSVIPKSSQGSAGTGTGIHNTGLIEAAQAELKAAGGNHYALAINNEGIIRANKLSNVGGKIFLGVEGGTIRNSGTLEAKGGTVQISAQNPAAGVEKKSLIEQHGTIDVSDTAEGAKGGTIRMEADRIFVASGSLADASGAAGGGTILVGGDYQGKNPEIYNAERLLVQTGARLRADATVAGDGGKVIVWADEWTGFYGELSAKGAGSGKGGFAEVSGKISLDFQGTADLTGPGGLGSLLLDPDSVVVTDANFTTSPPEPDPNVSFSVAAADLPSSMTLSRGFLESLVAASSVTIAATGDITINDMASNQLGFTAGGGAVSFQAGGNFTMVDINDKILTRGRDLSINAGTITVGVLDTSNMADNGGNLSLTAGAGGISAVQLISRSENVSVGLAGLGGDITLSSGGSIAVTGNAGVALNAGSKSSGGSASAAGDISITSTAGNVTMGGKILAASEGGSSVINNSGLGGNVGIEAIAGSVTVGEISTHSAAGGDAGAGGNVDILSGQTLNVGAISTKSYAGTNAGGSGSVALEVTGSGYSLTTGNIDATITGTTAANPGLISIEAPIVNLGGVTINNLKNSTVGQDMEIIADTINLPTVVDSIRANGKGVWLTTWSAGRQIDFGTDTSGKFSLTLDEMKSISASDVRIGSDGRDSTTVSGDIYVSAGMGPFSGISRLSFVTGGGMSQLAGAVLKEDEIAVTANGDILLNNAVNEAIFAAKSLGGKVLWKDANGWEIGTGFDGVNGIDAAGDILLQAGAGASSSLAAPLNSSGGDVVLETDDLVVTTTPNPATISGSKMLVIRPVTSGRAMTLGGAGSTGVLDVNSDELGVIQTGFQKVVMGSATTGAITYKGGGGGPPMPVKFQGASLDIQENFDSGSHPFTLDISGGVTQSAGKYIRSDNIELLGTGSYNLTFDEDVTLAANLTGTSSSLTLGTAGGGITITLGTVGPTVGVNLGSGAVSGRTGNVFTTNSNFEGTLTQSAPLIAGKAVFYGSGPGIQVQLSGDGNQLGTLAGYVATPGSTLYYQQEEFEPLVIGMVGSTNGIQGFDVIHINSSAERSDVTLDDPVLSNGLLGIYANNFTSLAGGTMTVVGANSVKVDAAGNLTVGGGVTSDGGIELTSGATLTVNAGVVLNTTGAPGASTFSQSGDVVMNGSYTLGAGDIILTGYIPPATTPVTEPTTEPTTESGTTTDPVVEQNLLNELAAEQTTETDFTMDVFTSPGMDSTDFVTGVGADGLSGGADDGLGGNVEGLFGDDETFGGEPLAGDGTPTNEPGTDAASPTEGEGTPEGEGTQEEGEPAAEGEGEGEQTGEGEDGEGNQGRGQQNATDNTTTTGAPVGPEKEVRPGQVIRMDRTGGFQQEQQPSAGLERALSNEVRNELSDALQN
jgi:filamentous hemagglutinin family protein